ncbi:MAG: hypothetical protein R3325_16345 [Thermoanaerobaculia bacterium]|nr:hypothetical protein [Thermoanaerobaculia bacterium]
MIRPLRVAHRWVIPVLAAALLLLLLLAPRLRQPDPLAADAPVAEERP